MSFGDRVNVRLHLSSNFVSGAYSIAELLIAVAFKHFVTVILESRNVKRIYVDNKSVELTSSNLWTFADHGLTSKTLHRLIFCLSAVVLVAGTLGGFGIVGVTEKNFETVTVKNLVKRAPSSSLVDFEKHFSVEENLVSGTVLLLREAFLCYRGASNKHSLFQYTNDLDDIASPRWPVETNLLNSTCVTKASGYEEQTTLEIKLSTLDAAESQQRCDWSVNRDEVPLMKVTQMKANKNEECPFRMLETWCFRSQRFFSCVALVRHSDGYSTTQIWTDSELHLRLTRIERFRQNTPVDTPILKSIAFLVGTGISPDLPTSHAMSLLTIEKNAYVKRMAGNHSVTEINLLLFGLTFVLALFITTVLGIVALFSWLFMLFLPGRLEYIRFSSATDMLNYAAVEAFGDEDRMRERSRVIVVGVDGTEPHVGPLKDPVKQGEEKFHEDELVGRRKLHR